MAEKEVKLMKGNEVIAHAAIRYGCDGYFGYPITPQSEVMETLMELKPWETTGMVVLQAESEISSINMVYGGASTGKRVMTSSSSPGTSLMSEWPSHQSAVRNQSCHSSAKQSLSNSSMLYLSPVCTQPHPDSHY